MIKEFQIARPVLTKQRGCPGSEEWLVAFEEIPNILEKRFGMHGIRLFREDLYGDYCYFIGNDDKGKIFVKWGGCIDSCPNEYKYNSRLYALNSRNFNATRFFCYEPQMKCLGLEFLEGENLEDLMTEKKISADDIRSILKQLVDISKTLIEGNCIHRDIKLKNFLYTSDKRLLLVDFQFATDFNGYEERELLLKELYLLRGRNLFRWDDMDDLLVILKHIGSDKRWECEYKQALFHFNENKGKRVIYLPGRNKLLAKRMFFKILAAPLPFKSWRDKVRQMYLPPVKYEGVRI